MTGLARVASVVALLFSSFATFGVVAAADAPTLTTGQADYAPGAVVDLHGSGFVAGLSYALPVKRPDGSIVLVDPATHAATPDWDVLGAGADGSLEYGYQLDGIQGSYEARAYPAGWNGDWSSIPVASVTFTDSSTGVDIDQCANGVPPTVSACPGSGQANWQNGDLNQNNSRYREGDSVPFRLRFSGLTVGDPVTVTIGWQVTKGSKHAYDYLTTWNRTITGANPCIGIAGCVLGSPTSIFPIPTDPSLAAACGFTGFQVPGHFTMWGGNLSAVSSYSLSGCAPDPDTLNSISITFTPLVENPVLAWGGHLASQADWGAGNAAGSISGAPYHMSMNDCTCVSGGHSQDRSIQTQGTTILPVPTITTAASPTTGNVGDAFTDTATITGTSGNGFPSGSVDFYYCGATGPTPPTCSLGGTLVGTSAVLTTLINAWTGTATSPAFHPTAQGIYCFRAVYNPSSSALYSSFQHTDQTVECFTVGNPNNAQTGSLRISKVLSPGASGFNTATQFAIDYSCDNGGPAGTVNLAGGTNQTITNIPVGSVCTVSEPGQPAAPAGYLWSVVVTGSPTAAITANNTESVTVTNSLVQQTGSLNISKVLDTGGSNFATSTLFTIHYDCGGAVSGDVQLAGGHDTTISAIPVGSVCTVSEPSQPSPPAGYSWTVQVTGSPTAAITANTTESVIVSNTLSAIVGEANGSLKITKTLDRDGSSFATSTLFTIHYDCGGGVSGDVQLAGGQDTTVGSIPAGASCTVTEPSQPAAPTGYSWTVVIIGSPASIVASQTAEVDVTNTLTRDTGSLTVTKTLVPGADPGLFNLQIDGVTEAPNVGDGGTTGATPENTGNHTVGETAGTSTSLAGYTSSISCTEDAAGGSNVLSPVNLASSGPATVPLASGDAWTCVITNTRNTGSLKITKTVDAGGSSFISGSFTVHVVCTGDGGTYNRTITYPSPDNVTITGIPSGVSCTVTETGKPSPPSGYSWGAEQISGSPATITTDPTAEVTVANTLTRDTGALKISKVLVLNGSTFNSATQFSIKYDCGSGISGTVLLAGGESTTISGIPTGSICSVTEPSPPAPPSQTTWSTVITGSPTAAISKGNTEQVTVTNTLYPPCEKLPVQTVLDPTTGHQYPGNTGPDYFVRVNHGDKVQAAVNAAALAKSATTGDINGDGYLIIMVSAHDDGTLGGSSTQNVVISAAYTRPFALIGCSVTLNDASLQDGNGTIKIASGASSTLWTISEGALPKSNIFLMDLHGSGSNVAGLEVWGNQRYLRNEGGSGNSGVGFKITGDSNTMHNGAANGNGSDGVYVKGNSNYLTDTNAMSNGGIGFNVVGASNKLLKLDAGEKGTPNTLDGVHVVGNTNTLTENDAYANLGDGIDVAGNGNVLSLNVAGDRTKGNGFATVAGSGFRILGASNNLTDNKASANKGDGFCISGTSTQTSSTANLIKNNLSNTGASGSDLENLGAEWRFFYWIKNNGGGNKADGVTLANLTKKLTNFPASGSTWNYGSAGQYAE